MHRLLVETALLSADSPALAKDAANHLKVVRVKKGEEVELFDGKGAWRRYSVAAVSPKGAATLSPVSAISRASRGGVSLTLFACVTKGSRWDWTVEKATELGVTRIVPVVSARTIVRISPGEREAKRARWTRIAEDAARQSDARWLPEVLAPVSFEESLALVRETTCFAGALVSPPPPSILSRALARKDAKSLALYVGPEGDFSSEELAALLEVAEPVSLGSAVLRAETAAIYGVGVLRAVLDAREG